MRTLYHKCDRCGVENESVMRMELLLRGCDERYKQQSSFHEETLVLCPNCIEPAADEMVNVKETIKRRWERGQ